MKLAFLVLTFAIAILTCISKPESTHLTLISDKLVYKSDKHAAFTAMVCRNETLFIAFREANVHNPKNKDDYGFLKIIKRVNDINVDTVSLKCDTADLRDPFLISVNGHLRLYCFFIQRKKPSEGNKYSGTMYSDYENGTWSKFESINTTTKETYILWKVRKYGELYYSIGYNMKEGPVLFCSANGVDWKFIKRISNNGNYTEGDLIENGNKLFSIIRNENPIGAPSVIFDSETLSNASLSRSMASPEIIRYDNNTILLAGREYDFTLNKRKPDSINVTLLMLNNDFKIIDRFVLPGKRLGDKGYPSICIKKDTIAMSYYVGVSNKSDIRMTKFLIQN